MFFFVNLAEMFAIVRGWTLLILDVSDKRSRSEWNHREISCNLIQDKVFCASSSNFADMVTKANRIDFGGHGSKVKVTMGIIDKCGVRGDASLCVVTF